jgi:hypothetical protein
MDLCPASQRPQNVCPERVSGWQSNGEGLGGRHTRRSGAPSAWPTGGDVTHSCRGASGHDMGWRKAASPSTLGADGWRHLERAVQGWSKEDRVSHKRQRWRDLPTSQRAVIVTVGTVDVGLRIWALADRAQRPATSVRGPKAGWALALSLASSAGTLPLAYLIVGRRRS